MRYSERTSSSSFLTAVIIFLAAALIACLWAFAASAATPMSGTVSDASPQAAWTGSAALPTANASCAGPSNPDCDNYQLSILPPSYAFEVTIAVASGPVDDYDLEVYGPSGDLVGSSGNSPGEVEAVVLDNPSAGTYTVSVANYAAVSAYSGTATLSGQAAQPQGNAAVSFSVFTPPEGMGTNAGEPSVGVSWSSDRVMFIAGLETLRVDFDDCSSPALDTWEDVSFPLTGTVTLDPILFTDPRTGRTFASQLAGKCSAMAYTDDDGESWTPSMGCGINSGVDHQTIGGGRFDPLLERDPEGLLYSNAVYYCSQDIAIAQCARSDTGGLTFAEATPIYSIAECGGLHGHVKVAPNDGTVYVPNKGCNGEQAVAVSEASGLLGSWQVRRVPGTAAGEWDPSVGIGADGTVYIGMTNGGRPMASVSFDKGLTWTTPYDVGRGAGPNGGDLLSTAFPVVAAGDGDRAAFGFLGAELGGDSGGENPDSGHVWYPYVAVTYDAGLTWTTVNVSPDDPVQRGTVCSAGTTCGGTRNLLDFNDLQVDREGRVIFAYADGCIGNCKKQGPNSASELATIARQKAGPRLFAAFDVQDVPAAPRSEASLVDAATGEVLVSWEEPDSRGYAILEYRVYRRLEGEMAGSLLASLGPADRSYSDFIDPDGPQAFYRVTAVNTLGEGTSCQWVTPQLGPTPANACAEPGITVLEDPTGDASTTLAEHDVQFLALSQPTDQDADPLVFTLKMAGLSSLPPNGTWPVTFVGADGNPYFVKMATDLLGQVSFAVGTGTDVTAAGQPAGSGSGFDADGTIRIEVPRSAVGSPATGDSLHSFQVRVRVETGLGTALTPDNMPDSVGVDGTYTLAACSEAEGAVTTCAGAAAPDAYSRSAKELALDLRGISRDLVFAPGTEITEYPDGTARLLGTAVDRYDVDRRFAVDVLFFDRRNAPPPGSPNLELHKDAYADQGGPVDPAAWYFYGTLQGTLLGEGDFAGSELRIYRSGSALQIGDGASNKNVGFGASDGISYHVETQPTSGSLPNAGGGTLSVDLGCF